jgi:tRNA threonylcarbamoyladenosine biosynthesis protein TsaB
MSTATRPRPKILALDTSTEYCSVALARGEELLFDGCHAGQRHSQLLLPMIDALLARAGVRLEELDAIAFGEGPGSFTGLRIACGVTQGLALGAGLQVIGISTLLALAQASRAHAVLCCLDARMGEVYAAAYRRDRDEWRTVLAAGLFSPSALPALPPGAWTGCGNGFAVYAQALTTAAGAPLCAIHDELSPHAREIAQLATMAFAQGHAKPPEQALPCYIRDKVALTIEEQR